MKNTLFVLLGAFGTSAVSLMLVHVSGYATCQEMVALSFFVACGLGLAWCASIIDVSQNAWYFLGTLYFLSVGALAFGFSTAIAWNAATGSYPQSLSEQRVFIPAGTAVLVAFAAMRFVRFVARRAP